MNSNVDTGCVFALESASLSDTGGTIYENIACYNGGIFGLIGSTISITDASFTHITAYRNGGILYSETTSNSIYTF
jgi:hypothetical protein